MRREKTIINLHFIAILTISLLIFGDLARKIAVYFEFEFTRYTAAVKLFLLLVYFIFFLSKLNEFFRNKIQRHIFFIILALIFLFFLSNASPFNNKPFNPYNIEHLTKYLFFPITFFVFYKAFQSRKFVKNIFIYYQYFFLANLIVIALSFIFDIQIFRSYYNLERFGYSGLINRPNQISYITISFILIYYYETIVLKRKKLFYLLGTILVSLLFGTKRIYFFLIIMLTFHITTITREMKVKNLIALFFGIIGAFLFRDIFYNLFESKFGIFIDIYQKKGFLSSIMSFRNETLTKTINEQIVPNWEVFNIFIGGADFTKIRPEMDLFDLFFFFGLIGMGLYFLFLKNFVSTLNIKSCYLKYTLLVCFFISFMSSGFLNSANIPFIFLINIYYLNQLTLIKQGE
ncbi:O-antigen ligase family protein [Leptobacterium sp. I13]|uniref:O-antigen ligase family protein n=1 Tax=Leptobacterium meishanense TaxID=3128904 RepID=UPI0030EF28C6